MQRVYHSRVEDVNKLRERLILVWCELDRTTPATSGSVVCRPVLTLKADILNIIYDCYSQNNKFEVAAL